MALIRVPQPGQANTLVTPESLQAQEQIGQNVWKEGSSMAPAASPWAAAARALMGGFGGWQAGQATERTANERNLAQIKARALMGTGKPVAQADLLELMGNQFLDPGYKTGLGAILQSQLKSEDEWVANPKTGQLYNKKTGEYKGGPAAAAQLALDDLAKIQDEYLKAPGVKEWGAAAPILDSMYASLTNPAAISDLQFINGVAKVLDPTSVVREAEGRQVLQSQSISQQTLGLLNRLMNGEQALTYDLRVEMYKLARERGNELYQQTQKAHDFWTRQAQKYGGKPDDLMGIDPLSSANVPADPKRYGTP